jgi:hypothetical protein
VDYTFGVGSVWVTEGTEIMGQSTHTTKARGSRRYTDGG